MLIPNFAGLTSLHGVQISLLQLSIVFHQSPQQVVESSSLLTDVTSGIESGRGARKNWEESRHSKISDVNTLPGPPSHKVANEL
jgi:hypothetical protein